MNEPSPGPSVPASPESPAPSMAPRPVVGPPRPPKKKGSSFTTVMMVVTAGALLVLSVVGGTLWYAASTPEGKQAVAVLRGGAELYASSRNAPGMAEVRALGCEQAIFVDFEQMLKVFETAGVKDMTPPKAGEPKHTLVCVNGRFGTPPSCDALASTYVKAVGRASGDFMVLRQQQGAKATSCSEQYRADGHRRR